MHAFPCDFHVGERTVAAMPGLTPHTRGPYREDVRKVVLDVDAAYPGARRHEARAPTLCLFPRIVPEGRTELTRLDQATTFGKLLEAGGWIFYPGLPHKEAQLRVTEALAAKARGFALTLGPDALRDPSIVATCIEALAN